MNTLPLENRIILVTGASGGLGRAAALALAKAGATRRAATKPWTVLLYFSADNDLEWHIYNNMREIEAVGGSDACVVQWRRVPGSVFAGSGD